MYHHPPSTLGLLSNFVIEKRFERTQQIHACVVRASSPAYPPSFAFARTIIGFPLPVPSLPSLEGCLQKHSPLQPTSHTISASLFLGHQNLANKTTKKHIPAAHSLIFHPIRIFGLHRFVFPSLSHHLSSFVILSLSHTNSFQSIHPSIRTSSNPSLTHPLPLHRVPFCRSPLDSILQSLLYIPPQL